MISKFDNCLFIHIPKVAGQSIETAFLHRAGLNWETRDQMLLKPNSDAKKGPPRLAHLTASEYVSLGYLSQSQFDAMYKFAFVRNPWDRLVSEYSYRKYPCSFKDFVFKFFPTAHNDDYKKGFDGYRHVIPQTDFVCDENGQVIVDFIGRFENLKCDFLSVSKNIIGEPIDLPFKNKSEYKSTINKRLTYLGFNKPDNKKHYSEFYDQETKDYVAKLYEKDIALFDYQFTEK
ncbi:sulfotransferase family protein [Pseudoalteromonas sp. C2R02]|uniref:sulfotransferase family protein n=1 Tax=Pseudoalteromonas sp. C2R02 TaxID=2841565 RepID=UPI001C093DE9|nr:sulfotransferase family protein [Pseudoalteromonas sp. C2R02]MBU2972632.1 sulfotransferase family protein [Pseudoalteromonas sp. C2R02]